MKNYTNQVLEHLKSEKCTHLYRQHLGCWSCQFVINKQF